MVYEENAIRYDVDCNAKRRAKKGEVTCQMCRYYWHLTHNDGMVVEDYGEMCMGRGRFIHDAVLVNSDDYSGDCRNFQRSKPPRNSPRKQNRRVERSRKTAGK